MEGRRVEGWRVRGDEWRGGECRSGECRREGEEWGRGVEKKRAGGSKSTGKRDPKMMS